MSRLWRVLPVLLLAGLAVAQSAVINVADFGARGDGTTDDTKAIQAAINKAEGRPVYLPAGKYLVTHSLTYHTQGYTGGLKLYGDGMTESIILGAFSNGAVINVDGSGRLYQFQLGGWIHDVGIEAKGSQQSLSGISLAAAWMFTIERVRIKDMPGDAIVTPLRPDLGSNPDAYATIFLTIRQSELSNNKGWGFNGQNGLGTGSLVIDQCRIGVNEAGGVYLGGHNARIINNAIFSNGQHDSGGVLLDYVQTNSNGAVIEGNEFDSNYAYHIWVKAGDTFRITGNRFNSWVTVWKDHSLHPAVHIRLGGAGRSVRDFDIERNYHRSQYSRTGAHADHTVVVYQAADANVDFGRIESPWIPAADNSPQLVKFGISGGALAEANIADGRVTGVSVLSGGAGYRRPPTAHVVGGGGSGAAVEATVENGRVTSVRVVSGGRGYSTAPAIVFDPQPATSLPGAHIVTADQPGR